MEGCNINQKDSVSGLVSIIIPTHNRINLINETIDSILNQIYDNIEIIIVDDHSTDGTYEFLLSKKKTIPKMNLFKSNKRGACAARNLGLEYANGEYIQFFDDDDIMDKKHIFKKVEILKNNVEFDFVACNFYYFKGSSNNIIGEKRLDNIQHTIESHILNNAFPAPSYFFRHKIVLKLGMWDEKCLRFQDIKYYHKIFLYNLNGFWIPDFLFFVRIHEQNLSTLFSKEKLLSMVGVYESIKFDWNRSSKIVQKKALNSILTLSEIYISLDAIKKKHFIIGASTLFRSIYNNPLSSVNCLYFAIYKLIWACIGKKKTAIEFYTKRYYSKF